MTKFLVIRHQSSGISSELKVKSQKLKEGQRADDCIRLSLQLSRIEFELERRMNAYFRSHC
jgi:hypothetical protein